MGWYLTSKACALRRSHGNIDQTESSLVFHPSIHISEHIIQIDTFLQWPDSICWVVLVQLWHLKVWVRAVLEKIRLQQCRGSFFTRPSLFRSKSILVSWRPCGDNTLSTESEFMSLATLKGTRWFVWLWKGTIRQTAELLWDTWKRPHPCGHKATSHIFTMKTMPVLQHLLRSGMNGGLQYGRDYYKRRKINNFTCKGHI